MYNATYIATTASPGTKTDLVRSLGADIVANHREPSLVNQLEEHGPFDVIYDCVGDLRRALPLAKEGGVVIAIAGYSSAESIQEFVAASGDRLDMAHAHL